MSDREYPINYFKEAFQLPINLILLTVMFFMFIGSFVVNYYFSEYVGFRIPSEAILSISAGFELLFLGLIVKNARFQKKINQKYLVQKNIYNEELEIAEIICQLSKESLNKFVKFYQKKDQLLQKTIDSGASSDGILMIVKENTDKLTKTYAKNLLISELYHKQLSQSESSNLSKELESVLSELKIAGGKKKNLLQQRAELLKKRIEKITSLREELSVADLQVKTIEDTLEYLRENSLSKSNINEFVNTIDEIYSETETYQNALKEIQEIL